MIRRKGLGPGFTPLAFRFPRRFFAMFPDASKLKLRDALLARATAPERVRPHVQWEAALFENASRAHRERRLARAAAPAVVDVGPATYAIEMMAS